jgi:mRNA deadenylase 3'-5' endonuclease subunit Ccr4
MFSRYIVVIFAIMIALHGYHSFSSSITRNNRQFKTISRKNALRMSTRVDITTYNVLSSHLANPDWFASCKPSDLLAANRLDRLKSKLLPKIKQNSIICLQEVSMTWTSDLHSYFSKHGYYFISTLYGNKFNNYMGVGIAVPLAAYDIVQVDIKRIADTIPMKLPKPEKPRFWKSLITSFFGMMKKKVDKNASDPWYQSLDRKNQMVSVILQSKQSNGKEFAVGTYHMPCMFQLPSVMMIHCISSARNIQNFAANRPYIFCGDFNIKPQSSMYQLLTKGSVEAEVRCPSTNNQACDLTIVPIVFRSTAKCAWTL